MKSKLILSALAMAMMSCTQIEEPVVANDSNDEAPLSRTSQDYQMDVRVQGRTESPGSGNWQLAIAVDKLAVDAQVELSVVIPGVYPRPTYFP